MSKKDSISEKKCCSSSKIITGFACILGDKRAKERETGLSLVWPFILAASAGLADLPCPLQPNTRVSLWPSCVWAHLRVSFGSVN